MVEMSLQQMREAGIAVDGGHAGTGAKTAHRFALVTGAAPDALVAAWDDLAIRAAEDNVFFTSDFALPAIGHLEPSVRIATVHRVDGRLSALAPVTRTRLGRILPAMRLWSHDYAPLGVPLVDADDVAGSVTALIEGLAPPGSLSSLILPMVPLDGPVAAAFRRAAESAGRPVAVLDAHRRAIVSRPAEGDIDLRRALPKKKRHERGRELRRLGEHGEVTIELASAPDIVRARFEEFLVLEAAGWKGEAGSALACRVATAEFAREAIFNRSEGRAARVVSLRLGDHPVAILVCFETGRTSYTWKIAYDETHARYSPGAQIMLDAPRLLFADTAIETIDSCASANHPMIDHLWSERLAVGTLVVGPVGGGAVYKLALAAAEAEIDARAMARRWREGRKKASTGS